MLLIDMFKTKRNENVNNILFIDILATKSNNVNSLLKFCCLLLLLMN